jgi:hypothetical protein
VARRLDNWIEGYLAYTAESESPEEFHRWVGLSVIAGTMRRKCFFDMGYFLIYPNLFTVLVARAGRCRKSTALRIGRRILSKVPDLNFTTDSITRERLILDMSQTFKDGHSSMTAFSSEFASLLTSSGMDMVVFLTDIYDSPLEWSHRTKSGGTNSIKAPCLTLIGATTPEWMAQAMPFDNVGIGLTSRIVFIYSDEPRIRDPFPKLSVDQQQLGTLLEEDLVHISQISGEYHMSPEVKKVYAKWYKGRVKDPNPTGDMRLSGYFERKPIHVLKLAMIIAASYRDEMEILEDDLHIAWQVLEESEKHMPRVFSAVGKNPLSSEYEVAMGLVMTHPEGVTKGELLKAMKHNVREEELAEIMNSLIIMGLVRQVPGPQQGVVTYKAIADLFG